MLLWISDRHAYTQTHGNQLINTFKTEQTSKPLAVGFSSSLSPGGKHSKRTDHPPEHPLELYLNPGLGVKLPVSEEDAP